MTEPVRVGSLRGIMMRGPGVSATLPFYEDMWGLSLSHQEDGLALLRGTGTEPFLYGLKDGPVFGIEYVHFAMPDRASMDALHAQIMAKGHAPISAPAAFDDWVGGYGFETLDPDNDALRPELTAVSQFWLHYRLLQNWGFGAMADKWRHESIEEMEHADQLIARIVFLEGAPNLQKLDPLMIGDTVREVLDADLKAEYRARALYREGRDAAGAVGDHVTKLLFETLMSDEEGHIDFLESEIDLFDRIGEAEYGTLNATPTNEAGED